MTMEFKMVERDQNWCFRKEQKATAKTELELEASKILKWPIGCLKVYQSGVSSCVCRWKMDGCRSSPNLQGIQRLANGCPCHRSILFTSLLPSSHNVQCHDVDPI